MSRARRWFDRHPVASGAMVVAPLATLNLGAGVLWALRAMGVA